MRAVALVSMLTVLSACGAGVALNGGARDPSARVALVVEHEHVPRYHARLVEMRWWIDAVEIGSERWDIEAPELARTLASAALAPGAHTITIEARYVLYTCCYACGFMQPIAFRTDHRIELGGERRICFRTGGGGLTAPIEASLPALPHECDEASSSR